MSNSLEDALAKLGADFREGMTEMVAAVQQTNQQIDQTNTKLAEFESSMTKKLDGIGSYRTLIDGTFVGHEQRISNL